MMVTIMSIEPQPRKKGTYQLTLDDGRIFSVHEEVVAKYRLKSGMELDEEQLHSCLWEGNVKIAVDLALSYLGFRTRTRKQLCDYLERKGFETSVIEEAAHRMEEYRFLDDKEFALRWVQSKISGQPAGRRKIAFELKNKGISQEILDMALNTLTEEDEYKQAAKLAEKYERKYKLLPARERKSKIGQALQRRGFGWEMTTRVISHMDDGENPLL